MVLSELTWDLPNNQRAKQGIPQDKQRRNPFRMPRIEQQIASQVLQVHDGCNMSPGKSIGCLVCGGCGWSQAANGPMAAIPFRLSV